MSSLCCSFESSAVQSLRKDLGAVREQRERQGRREGGQGELSWLPLWGRSQFQWDLPRNHRRDPPLQDLGPGACALIPPARSPGVAPRGLTPPALPGVRLCWSNPRAEEPEEQGLGGEGAWGARPPGESDSLPAPPRVPLGRGGAVLSHPPAWEGPLTPVGGAWP